MLRAEERGGALSGIDRGGHRARPKPAPVDCCGATPSTSSPHPRQCRSGPPRSEGGRASDAGAGQFALLIKTLKTANALAPNTAAAARRRRSGSNEWCGIRVCDCLEARSLAQRASSNAQHDQFNKANAGQQHRNRNEIIFEPMTMIGKHYIHPIRRRSLPDADYCFRELMLQCLPHARFKRISPQGFRFRGLWQKAGQRFALCGGNPASSLRVRSRSSLESTNEVAPVKLLSSAD
jgi:hypothetical protein